MTTFDAIYFSSRGRDDYKYLSNFYPCELEIDGKVWPSVEHYYQAQKTMNIELQESIRLRATALDALRAGGTLNYIRQDWILVGGEPGYRNNVMRKALEAKFQDWQLASWLIDTYPHELRENTAHRYWGYAAGNGHNVLGAMLMAVRAGLLIKLKESVFDGQDEIDKADIEFPQEDDGRSS